MKIVTAAQMRHIEELSARMGLPPDTLMENAGRAVAEAVRRTNGEQPVLVLVGPGNNGGDGLVAARCLHDWRVPVTVYLVSRRRPDDPNLRLVRKRGIPVVEGDADPRQGRLDEALASAAAVLDAVFGTGRSRAIGGMAAAVLARVTAAHRSRPGLHIIAVDLPSGLDADTGAVDAACPADVTVTLGFPKVGLFNFPGAERAGQIEVADIGIPPHLADGIALELITARQVRSRLPRRPLGANKGTFGKVMVVAGSINYIGAAYLACSGAMRVGAGLVTLATPASLQPVLAGRLVESTYLPLPEGSPGTLSADAARAVRLAVRDYRALLVGCGLGQSPAVVDFLRALLLRARRPPVPLVIDADGLNGLAKVPQWWRRLPDDAILTPHPGEMARLTGLSVEQIQKERTGVAGKMAGEWRKTVVLKGAYTVVAAPDGGVAVSPFANPALASAGTGDVLAGAIAGLLAQGLPPFDAAVCGVYLHGRAAEMVAARLGDAGVLASDLLPELPPAIKQTKGV